MHKPALTPQTTLDACTQNFSRFNIVRGRGRERGGREIYGQFKKKNDALFYEETEKLEEL